MEKNEDLAYATLDYIREHPEEWDQDVYACDATACFAGRALILSGWKGDYWRQPAADALGWTGAEASSVFYLRTTDFAELEAAVKRVLAGEITEE